MKRLLTGRRVFAARNILVGILLGACTLAFVAALINSTPLLTISTCIAAAAFSLACICTDINEFGR